VKKAMTILFVGVAVLAGCSTDGTTNDSGREIEIAMRDSFFRPGKVTVRAGSTVTFRFVNRGKLTHEAFIGDAGMQKDHEDEMRMANESDEGHGGEHGSMHDAVTVKPGRSATLTHRFGEPGTLQIGCHEPGHYAAGMKVTVTVR
jgi:uncharacterized cupredoxin-like copper-binding protein